MLKIIITVYIYDGELDFGIESTAKYLNYLPIGFSSKWSGVLGDS